MLNLSLELFPLTSVFVLTNSGEVIPYKLNIQYDAISITTISTIVFSAIIKLDFVAPIFSLPWASVRLETGYFTSSTNNSKRIKRKLDSFFVFESLS